MKLEDQVVSLELAKKLKEAGYSQDGSLFYWVRKFDANKLIETDRIIQQKSDYFWCNDKKHKHNPIAAPTVAELGVLIADNGGTWYQDKKWYWNWENAPIYQAKYCITTEADARAELWLYLKENNLLKE